MHVVEKKMYGAIRFFFFFGDKFSSKLRLECLELAHPEDVSPANRWQSE